MLQNQMISYMIKSQEGRAKRGWEGTVVRDSQDMPIIFSYSIGDNLVVEIVLSSRRTSRASALQIMNVATSFKLDLSKCC